MKKSVFYLKSFTRNEEPPCKNPVMRILSFTLKKLQ